VNFYRVVRLSWHFWRAAVLHLLNIGENCYLRMCLINVHRVCIGGFATLQTITKAPLPTFSSLVLQHIDGKDAVPERVWSLMINEAALYYLTVAPDIADRQHYEAIGSRMYGRYPAIGLDGANPWVSFFTAFCLLLLLLLLTVTAAAAIGQHSVML